MEWPHVESILLSFWLERQRECKMPLDVVSVTQQGGGVPNGCFLNTSAAFVPETILITSGWLALPYNHEKGFRQFTQHWWNYDKRTRKYIDTTPEIEEGAIYVLDMDIAHFAAEHNSDLISCVPQSVIYRDGRFLGLRTDTGQIELVPLQRLSTENLFRPYLRHESSMVPRSD